LGIDTKTICEELTKVLRSDAPSYPIVARWAKRFREGREDGDGDPRFGRPISVLTDKNIEHVRQIIEHDPHLTYDDIIAETFISHGTIERIIYDCLKMRKVTSRWVPINSMTNRRKNDLEFVKI
jgi:transposase